MPGFQTTFSRFYSIAGRASVARILLVACLAGAVLWGCAQASWEYGLVAAAITGALAGAALAKLVVEAVRRLRDAGIDRRAAAWGCLALGVFVAAAFASFFFVGPQMGRTMLSVATWITPPALIVPLLWPGRPGRADGVDVRGSRGLHFAIACIVGGIAVALFLAWLSIGMDESNRRGMALGVELSR
jgi:hypothetical protein